MKNISDREIIESVKKGNQKDFALLVDKYKNKAFSLLKRMIKNDMEAEEILQDCFLKAYKGLSNFRGDSEFSTWFYKIVYNTALSRLTVKKRLIESRMESVEDHHGISYSDIAPEVELKDLLQFLNRMVEDLPPDYSAVVSLFYQDSLSCQEIAKVMETSVSNVKVLLYRARNTLKDILLKKNLIRELT
ncbi:MAG: RNA polymerase sigma factor RpoE [Ignavibacteriaceae bacterium]